LLAAGSVADVIGLLVVMLGAAKLLGFLARRVGQPAVLGELVAGVVLGSSVLGWVDARSDVLHVLAELGVVLLLFEIGLETDHRKLLEVGGGAMVVAVVGVIAPFILGYFVCRAMGLAPLKGVVAGASLTATSVGITARVLSDLGRLQELEGRIILGAAVLDDVIGLVILSVVDRVTEGEAITAWMVLRTTAVAFGFLLATLLVGRLLVPPLFGVAKRIELPGTVTMLAVLLALGLAWLAEWVGSALIIGAFAAGILLGRTAQAPEIQRGVVHLGHFFVPLFFILVGAQVDVRVLNPLDPDNRPTLVLGGLLIVAAVAGKFAAGYGPFWIRARKSVIGAGMIPRGEVGLIFADRGLATNVFDSGLYSAVTLMVMVTTFIVPPWLKSLLPPRDPRQRPSQPEGVGELVTEA
jgi:Kef-type K+ transport system membrane component KefB